jgi:hypothetical protein
VLWWGGGSGTQRHSHVSWCGVTPLATTGIHQMACAAHACHTTAYITPCARKHFANGSTRREHCRMPLLLLEAARKQLMLIP